MLELGFFDEIKYLLDFARAYIGRRIRLHTLLDYGDGGSIMASIRVYEEFCLILTSEDFVS
jgi:hypothetical protein